MWEDESTHERKLCWKSVGGFVDGYGALCEGFVLLRQILEKLRTKKNFIKLIM
jgi:hypothetical protein